MTPLSANQVQISAKKAGVTQVNLWDEDGKIHTVDVLIYGDVRELEVALQTQFPHSSIKVFRYSESLVLKGFVDQPEHVSQIMQLASDYAPKVINNITVGGVQQVLLKVKVMEVSRTKLRQLGRRLGVLRSAAASFARQSALADILSLDHPAAATGAGRTTQATDVRSSASSTATTRSLASSTRCNKTTSPRSWPSRTSWPSAAGRHSSTSAANFRSSCRKAWAPRRSSSRSTARKSTSCRSCWATATSASKCGRGSAKSTRPRSVIINGNNVPGLTVREVDTAVEMKAGQTFALAGLVQERTEGAERAVCRTFPTCRSSACRFARRRRRSTKSNS